MQLSTSKSAQKSAKSFPPFPPGVKTGSRQQI